MEKKSIKQSIGDTTTQKSTTSGRISIPSKYKIPTKYNSKWEELYDWVDRSKKGDNYVFCKICFTDLHTGAMGQTALTRHHKSVAHNSWETVTMVVTETKPKSRLNKSNTTCLVCLEKENTVKSIFDKDSDNITIADKISECSGLKIHKIMKNMTENICSNCHEKLNVAYKFRKACEKSYEILKNSDYKPNSSKIIKEYILGTSVCDKTSIDFDDKHIKEEPETSDDADIDFNSEHDKAEHETIELSIEKNSEESKDDDEERNLNEVEYLEGDEYFFIEESIDLKSVNKKKASVETHAYMCDICGNKFKNNSSLTDHRRRHLNNKPYKCEFCEKAFVVSFELDRHMRVHTREKPHSCQHCGRKFADLSTRNRHERTHTGERPYGCQLCGKKFTYAHTLKRHYDVHTGTKNFVCQFCDKGFTKKIYLEAHLKKYHNQNE